MSKFRFMSNESSSRQRDYLRIGLWTMVAALLGITVFSIYGPHVAQLNAILASLAALIVGTTIILAYTLAFRHALDKIRRESSFLLTHDSLIYKRRGHPDVQIGLSV